MSNSYNTIAAILEATPSINTFLLDSERYYAHVLPNYTTVSAPPETLQEHIELVQKKFALLAEAHRLDSVVDSLIATYLQKNNLIGEIELGNFIKKLFVNTIVFHDFGKTNENFQASPIKMNNPYFRGKERFASVLSTHHSALGAYIYLVKHLDEMYNSFEDDYQRQFPMLCAITLSYNIFKHHANYLRDNIIDTIGFKDDKIACMQSYLSLFNYHNTHPYFREEFLKSENMKSLFNSFEVEGTFLNSFELYALVRLNFSLLTASDYLASGDYISGGKVKMQDVGILQANRINEIFDFVSQSEKLKNGNTNYNKDTYDKLKSGFIFNNPTDQSGANLNILRQEMAAEVIQNIRANSDKNLFYIEAPTGGGKTNLSMLATIELLKAHQGKLNKVFYVFPFTTLITQTYKAIIDTLGLSENEVTQLHSKAGYKTKDPQTPAYGTPAPADYTPKMEQEEIEDGLYSDKKLNYVENLFVSYPFCLLSHVKFFDLLKTNEKEGNYMLHRLANAIVVIDELQSYNPTHWDKMMYFIRHFAKHFNMKFILMSATLPKLGNLKIIQEEVKDVVYLLNNPKTDYFLNPNFNKRVTFKYDFFERQDLQLSEIATVLLEKSKCYAEKDFGNAKPYGSVYSIIEFIFKKTATEFMQVMEAINDGFFDEMFLLSGTVLEHRRKYIINFLKNAENRKKRILLVTTQVVEAGVDIDMDLGFKDRSLIDSEEQLAGRINRNVNKEDCELYLFNYNKESIIYGEDKRYKLTKQFSSGEYQRILEEKNFDYLYDMLISRISDLQTNDKIDKENNEGLLKYYKNNIEKLRFESAATKFKLIDQNNISCFVPLLIPITVQGITADAVDEVFSKNELSFLAQHDVYPNTENKIEGERVFDIYLDFIQNKREFTAQKIGQKTLQGIMSKFIFSLFATDNIKKQIVHYSDEVKSEYGYKYVRYWYKFYDENSGMNDSKFHSNETQFL